MMLVPLNPSQPVTFDLDLNAKRYTFTFTYNSIRENWTVAVALKGVELVTGYAFTIGAELFRSRTHPDIPKNLYAIPFDGVMQDAKFDEIGVRVQCLQILEGELDG